jgi:hypothetical protein
MGSGTWTFNYSNGYATTLWNFGTTTGLTFNSGSSTIQFTGTSSGGKAFIGGGLAYNNIILSGDNITVSGSNTFNTFAVNNAGLPNGLILTSGTTQTIAPGGFSDNGSSSSNLSIIHSTTGGIQASLSMPSGTVNANYMVIQDSNATGGATWYAGANSINVSDNTGWQFTSPTYIIQVDGLLLAGD